LDAYEKLKSAKRGNESFSQVVRRGHFESATCTGEAILETLKETHRKGRVLPHAVLKYWEDARKADIKKPRISIF